MLTHKEINDSQELVWYMMEIIDSWFLEKKPTKIVLEIRKVLTLYDEDGERNDLDYNELKNLSWLL